MRAKHLLYLAAGYFLLFSLIPSLMFGIFNAGVLLFLLAGVTFLVLPRIWKRLGKRIRFLCGSAVALGLCFAAALSSIMLWWGWNMRPPEAGVQAVIVLGGKVNGTQPSLMLRQRLDVAADYLLDHPEVLCVVSGGQGRDEEVTEAWAMSRYLIAAGIDADRILLEDLSVNTRQNIAYSYNILAAYGMENPIVAIISNDFHQYRAAIYCQRTGFSEHYALSSVGPRGLQPTYWVREFLAIFRAWTMES